MERSSKYQWQGKPVKVIFGSVHVKTNHEKPLWWYNYECETSPYKGSALLPAIQIEMPDGYKFTIANHYGIGVHKLIRGGWPNHQHFSLPNEDFTEAGFKSEPYYFIKKFDELEFSQHEAFRDRWQKANYPEEFEKMQSLRRMIK